MGRDLPTLSPWQNPKHLRLCLHTWGGLLQSDHKIHNLYNQQVKITYSSYILEKLISEMKICSSYSNMISYTLTILNVLFKNILTEKHS